MQPLYGLCEGLVHRQPLPPQVALWWNYSRLVMGSVTVQMLWLKQTFKCTNQSIYPFRDNCFQTMHWYLLIFHIICTVRITVPCISCAQHDGEISQLSDDRTLQLSLPLFALCLPPGAIKRTSICTLPNGCVELPFTLKMWHASMWGMHMWFQLWRTREQIFVLLRSCIQFLSCRWRGCFMSTTSWRSWCMMNWITTLPAKVGPQADDS